MADKTVVVTGANGFIASWLVKLLLERGYNVRGTVRDPKDESKLRHLLELPGAQDRLVLYRAELMAEGDFDEVVDGADCVMHTASKVSADFVDDPYKEIVDPAVKGTLNVLKSAAKTKTVKRVVYTSSMSAVVCSDRFVNRSEDDVVDETWWTDPDFCQKLEMYYHLGKTLAERAAFEYAKDAPFDLVSIVPCTVLGGLMQETVNWSSSEVLRILQGIQKQEDDMIIPTNVAFVDVEDVATAHILAMENSNAEGRHLAVSESVTIDYIALLLAKLYPQYKNVLKPDMKGMDEATFSKPLFKFSNDKLKHLGLNFTPIAGIVKKTVQSLQQFNLV
ncbi:protein MpDFR-like3 [Marchantia polymorpha subsp. ruderalis]|nr:hypothetical protein MARPO_0028s0134 [Marchantia polymorpha]PTQ42843.1 hypothetical protein MARPO_0028s0134 [Marchantia polymorpha]BBN00554.1 hypothetical protein Mp_2g00170 [Marchantia polymorpha subsp. ruderalis]BBN00555.1 hypothetical protein Mp_2g00170 [Marchantia polymorpha subsp. ruderalis]|eukprot:PTQ42842.1 hypothetical protein MARPO_0028s0134 [Marchantia polymorpha]